MSDVSEEEESSGHLSDREILLLVRSDVKYLRAGRYDHEKRIGNLERVTALASGAIAVVGAVVGWMKIKVSVQ